MRNLSVLILCLLLAACALTPVRPPTDPEAARCLALYESVDRTVAEQGYSPSSPARIDGFPYLRVNRFLAGYRDQPLKPAQRAAWLTRLAELDQAARQVELASLPPPILAELTAQQTVAATLPAALQSCLRQLQTADLADPERFAALRERATVPPDYFTWRQVLGLYPLSSLPISFGVTRWHRETYQTFAQPLDAVPVQGRLQHFRPPEEINQPPTTDKLPRDALDIPSPDVRQLTALFAAYAPVWEIDVTGTYDLPGVPYWQADGKPSVNSANPMVYRYPSYTRWRGQPLLQLNYLIWFSERPAGGPLDILAGPLDGVIWRVTLNSDGSPLLYDSIHACGCYHQFFPSSALRLRPAALELPEPPLVPQAAPAMVAGKRLVIRLGSGSHYIQRVYAGVATGSTYIWEDYRALYAVSYDGQRRSLFGPDGLVAGTGRSERWLLWPMGIPSPGAMRERGRHATAFIGRRHFDDADLLDSLFEPVETNR